MPAVLLDGDALLEHVKDDLRVRVDKLVARGMTPGLGTIVVGDDPNSASYVRRKRAAMADIGVVSHHVELPTTSSQADVMAAISEFNEDPSIDGYIVQLPLPGHLDEETALYAVDPAKDVDGLHPVNLGRLLMGAPGPRPCTALGIQTLLVHYGVTIERQHVVIIGRGLTVGRPLSVLLSLKERHANATVTQCHTGTTDLAERTREADIVVAAAGVASIVTPDMIRPGAAVVSAGLTWEGRRLIPDVDEACAEVAGWITPRLGGVGPTTIAMLLRNTVEAAERR
jgi:methylenetetrahydrofolate dehydrogenase (NADP+)/methenyltetrahydrofolate cyclohydrolase